MAFSNDDTFQDDFRKVGPDATAGFEQTGSPDNSTEHAGSESLYAAAADEDDDLEDEEVDEDDEEADEEEDDLEDDDLEDEDEDGLDEDEDDDLEDDDLDEDDEANDEEDDAVTASS